MFPKCQNVCSKYIFLYFKMSHKLCITTLSSVGGTVVPQHFVLSQSDFWSLPQKFWSLTKSFGLLHGKCFGLLYYVIVFAYLYP